MIWQPKEDQDKAWEDLFKHLKEIRSTGLKLAHYTSGAEMLGMDGRGIPVPVGFVVTNIVFADDRTHH